MAGQGTGKPLRVKRAGRGLTFSFSIGAAPAKGISGLFRSAPKDMLADWEAQRLTHATASTWSVRRESVHDAAGSRTVYRVSGPDGVEQTFDEFHDLPEEARRLLEHAPAFFGETERRGSAPASSLQLTHPERQAFVPRDPFARDEGRGGSRAGLLAIMAALLAGIFGVLLWMAMQGSV